MADDLSVHQAEPPAAPVVQVALYARVSTANQNCELQLRELQEYAVHQGWHVVEVCAVTRLSHLTAGWNRFWKLTNTS